MSYEPPQKGNPNKLTINQHTFPRASIARFAGPSGRVQLFHTESKKVFPAKPTERLFCAQRVWAQSAESGYMKDVEDAFQALAEAILDGRVHRFDLIEASIISAFYCLWNIRAHFKRLPIEDQSFARTGVVGLARHYTKDDQERLEINGIFSIRPDLTMAGRFLTSPQISQNLMMAVESMGDAQWGILHAMEGEFIVPDNFNQMRVVPISPTICLWSQTSRPVELLDRHAVAEINRGAIRSSIDYYFARNLDQCPILPGHLF